MKPRAAFILLIFLTGALFCLSIGAGALSLTPAQLLKALFGQGDARTLAVLVELRLPRALTALCGGAGLAAAGCLMQTLFGNPLAGPDVLGINSGASLGIAALLLATSDLAVVGTFIENLRFMGGGGLVTAATAGAAAVMALIQLMALRVRRPVTLLVLGMMIGYAVSSAVNIMISVAMPVQTQAFLSWSFGSFSGTEMTSAVTLGLCCGSGILVSTLLSKGLDALHLGEESARALGVNVVLLRHCAIAAASLMAGAVTAFCGPVSFLGIAVPHVSRLICPRSSHRVQLPLTALTGASMALAADLLSRTAGGALPLNSVTSLMGVPVVLWVILKGHRKIDG